MMHGQKNIKLGFLFVSWFSISFLILLFHSPLLSPSKLFAFPFLLISFFPLFIYYLLRFLLIYLLLYLFLFYTVLFSPFVSSVFHFRTYSHFLPFTLQSVPSSLSLRKHCSLHFPNTVLSPSTPPAQIDSSVVFVPACVMCWTDRA